MAYDAEKICSGFVNSFTTFLHFYPLLFCTCPGTISSTLAREQGTPLFRAVLKLVRTWQADLEVNIRVFSVRQDFPIRTGMNE